MVYKVTDDGVELFVVRPMKNLPRVKIRNTALDYIVSSIRKSEEFLGLDTCSHLLLSTYELSIAETIAKDPLYQYIMSNSYGIGINFSMSWAVWLRFIDGVCHRHHAVMYVSYILDYCIRNKRSVVTLDDWDKMFGSGMFDTRMLDDVYVTTRVQSHGNSLLIEGKAWISICKKYLLTLKELDKELSKQK